MRGMHSLNVARTGTPTICLTPGILGGRFREGNIMSVGDKAKDFVQKAAGHAEEFVGKKTDDDELKHQGQKDQVMGEARKKTEDVKDELGK